MTFGVIFLISLYYWYRWKIRSDYKKRVLQSGIREIDVMTGKEFEKFLGTLFESSGYKIQLTKASGDFGADLIMKREGKVIAVQAKRYSKTVGISAIQESHASKSYYNADEAWVITNNDFSHNAQELAKKSGVKLVNREGLINLITYTRQH